MFLSFSMSTNAKLFVLNVCCDAIFHARIVKVRYHWLLEINSLTENSFQKFDLNFGVNSKNQFV